ncbi:sensor histidine kinase [Kribbia dieselivorans]|uniref:sensor histidine kinase n=1 Tax=Kribbia dieselivorans TaxID=331526 RepID=UPI000837F402|nr:ATP-binding protein [Kribbia dieselivorans]
MIAAKHRSSRGLAARLLVGQTIVLVAGALTVGIVAAIVGPPLFHQHLIEAGHVQDSPELAHIEIAYRDASLISVGVGVVISLMAAGAVTWVLTRRLRGPLDQVTSAARELARGHYATRVPDVASGTELETLAAAFNTMAARLEGIEDTRRRMLSDLAHELRTPIAALAAYHEGLHDGVVELGSESRIALAGQTDRLARLADDIDDVSTAEEGRLELQLQRHLVPDLLSAAHDEQQERYAAKAVDLIVDPAAAALPVWVDRNRIGQVLTNVLTNALRHTARGGTVTLSAQGDGENVAITVSDDGEGMTSAQLAHIFERFYRGDSARSRDRSGTGIGLTISKAIVDAHGGFITATSPGLGLGTVVRIELPAHR